MVTPEMPGAAPDVDTYVPMAEFPPGVRRLSMPRDLRKLALELIDDGRIVTVGWYCAGRDSRH
jgi:hypothetical protein